MSVKHFKIDDVTDWVQHTDRQIFLADVLDSSNSENMSVWFGRYGAGESNDWIVTYDEVIFIIEGRFTVRGEDGAKTAGPGELIFLTKGTKVTYSAEVPTLVAGATYPHWQDAQRESSHAHMLDDFHPA
ncbi:MAG: cupin [Rubrivivax sp.]|nr:cupin [Pyrinomonadaceae bacterium]